MSVTVTLDTAELEAVRERIGSLAGRRVEVGIFRDAGTHVVQGPHTTGLTVAQLAAFHEFGLGVPERSFLRRTFLGRKNETGNSLGQAAARVIVEGQAPEQALGVQAEVMAGWVKSAIANREIKQDLAPSTIARKARTNVRSGFGTAALIDTGQLIQAITGRVK